MPFSDSDSDDDVSSASGSYGSDSASEGETPANPKKKSSYFDSSGSDDDEDYSDSDGDDSTGFVKEKTPAAAGGKAETDSEDVISDSEGEDEPTGNRSYGDSADESGGDVISDSEFSGREYDNDDGMISGDSGHSDFDDEDGSRSYHDGDDGSRSHSSYSRSHSGGSRSPYDDDDVDDDHMSRSSGVSDDDRSYSDEGSRSPYDDAVDDGQMSRSSGVSDDRSYSDEERSRSRGSMSGESYDDGDISDSDNEENDQPPPRRPSYTTEESQRSVLDPDASSYSEELPQMDDENLEDSKNPIMRESPPKSDSSSPPKEEEVKRDDEPEPSDAPSPVKKKAMSFGSSESDGSDDDSTEEKNDPAPQKKSVLDDSDSDGSDDESTEEKKAAPKKKSFLDDPDSEDSDNDIDSGEESTKKEAPKKKSYLDSSDDESDSDDESTKEKQPPAPAPVPPPAPKKKSVLDSDSDDDDISDSDESDDEPKAATASPKKKSYLDSSDSDPDSDLDDESDSDSSDKEGKAKSVPAPAPPPPPAHVPEEEEPKDTEADVAAAAAKKREEERLALLAEWEAEQAEFEAAQPPAQPPANVEKKKSYMDSSDDDSGSDGESDSDSSDKKGKVETVPAPAPATAKKKAYLDSSDSDSGSDDSDSDSSNMKRKTKTAPSPKPPPPTTKKSSLDSSDSDDISDSDDSSDKKAPASTPTKKPKKKSYLDSSDDSDSDSDDDISDSDSSEEKAKAPTGGGKARSKGPLHCSACGTEAEFASEGLFACDACQTAHYCSTDCANWHFKSGGHADVCKGGSAIEKDSTIREASESQEDMDASISAFDPAALFGGAPDSQEGIMAALARSRDEAKAKNASAKPQKCKACGMDSEFVPEGMKQCRKCQKVPYCSLECEKWDWEQGGHRQMCSGISEAERNMNPLLEEGEDSDGSIEAFDPAALSGGPPDSKEGIMAALARSRDEANKTKSASSKPQKCKACGTDSEFVPEGMTQCPKCNGVAYCSKECVEWDWEQGGHKQVCSGISEAERKRKPLLEGGGESDGSIEAFDAGALAGGVPDSQEGIMAALARSRDEAKKAKSTPTPNIRLKVKGGQACDSCGMEEDFVPEGMLQCDKCRSGSYCSTDCKNWHWEHGGHSKVCEGATAADRRTANKAPVSHDSDGSIEAFDPAALGGGAPDSSEGIMAALARSREEASKAKSASVKPQKCKACGMDPEFVPEGMLQCSKCHGVTYCSKECVEWDWEQGGHKGVCPGISEFERKKRPTQEREDMDASISAFDPGALAGGAPSSSEGIMAALARSREEAKKAKSAPTQAERSNQSGGACQSCGMEEDFVPEGMITCNKCFGGSYCSTDCRNWHWERGGHKQACSGISEAERKMKPIQERGEDMDASISAFDPGALAGGAPSSSEGIMAALARSREEASRKKAPPAKPASRGDRSCQSCGMEEEFVPEGLIQCNRCFNCSYCSTDCMGWHWEHGGHRQVCQGATSAERKVGSASRNAAPTSYDSDGSIDVLEPSGGEGGAPQSKEGILAALASARAETRVSKQPSVPQNKCAACSMDKEFVPEGMKSCSRCKQVPYCSFDCMDWHWKSTHKQECRGISEAERRQGDKQIQNTSSADADDGSIDVFDPSGAGEEAPQSQAEMLAALSKAREEASSARKVPTGAKKKSNPVSPSPALECQGCGMEDEFVADGMRMCPNCKMVPYCSLDCMSWHWERGGHREVCPGRTEVERKGNRAKMGSANQVNKRALGGAEDDGSIEAFDAGGMQGLPSQGSIMAALAKSREEAASLQDKGRSPAAKVQCKACGTDEEFVPDGMKKCQKCFKETYCSEDCMKWDWLNGGHKGVCKGALSVVPAKSTLSIRDQITGGNDVQAERKIYNEPQKPAGHPKEVSTVKLELERTKRQYNDALLSKAALERALNDVARAAPPGSTPQADTDGLRDSVERFLVRLEGLLESDRNKARGHPDSKEDLAEKIMGLEKTIQGLVSQGAAAGNFPTYESPMHDRGIASGYGREPDGGKNALLRDLSDRWDAIVAESNGLRDQLERATDQRDQLQVAKEASDRLVQEKEGLLSKVCDTIAGLETEVSRIGGEHRKIESQNHVLETELDHATRKLGHLQLEKESSDQILYEKEALVSKLSELITELDREVYRNSTQQRALETELVQANSALAKHRDTKDRLERSFYEAETEIQGLRQHLREMDAAIEASVRPNGAMQNHQARTAPSYPAIETRGYPSAYPPTTPSRLATPSYPSTPTPVRGLPDHLERMRNARGAIELRNEVSSGTPRVRNTSGGPSYPFVDTSRIAATYAHGMRTDVPERPHQEYRNTSPYAFPSQRPDAVGQAIRDRAGVRLSGIGRDQSSMGPRSARNRAAPLPLTTAPARQREDAKEPRGKRLSEDYTKRLKAQSKSRDAPNRGGQTTRTATERPRKDGTDLMQSTQLPPVFRDPGVPKSRFPAPWKGPEATTARTNTSELTPTEQRMAYIQQRIAKKVELNKRKSAVPPESNHPRSQPSSLRPQYGPSGAPNQSGASDRQPARYATVTGMAKPSHSAQQAYPRYHSGAPSYGNQLGQPHLSNHPLPYTQAAPRPSSGFAPSRRQQQHPPAVINTRTGRDAAGARRVASFHGDPFVVRQEEPYPLYNKPRYAVQHHVDPKGLQDVRNNRWKNVLGSSKIL